MDSGQERNVPAKKKARKSKEKPWEEKEDMALIIEVLEREHILFGEIKGSGVTFVVLSLTIHSIIFILSLSI